MRALTYLMLAVMAALAASPADAQAPTCENPREPGVWINKQAKLKELSSVEIEYFCPDNPTFGAWRLRAKTRCHPRDCSWGWSPGERTDPTTLKTGFQGFYTTIFLTLRFSAGALLAEVETHSEKEAPTTRNYRLTRDK